MRRSASLHWGHVYVYSNSHTAGCCQWCNCALYWVWSISGTNHWILLQLTRSISGSHKIGLQFPWPWINLTDLVRCCIVPWLQPLVTGCCVGPMCLSSCFLMETGGNAFMTDTAHFVEVAVIALLQWPKHRLRKLHTTMFCSDDLSRMCCTVNTAVLLQRGLLSWLLHER